MTIWYAQWYADAPNTPEFQTPVPALSYNDVTQSFSQNGVTQIVQNLLWGGGNTSHAFTVTGITSASVISADLVGSANAVSILKSVCTTNTVTVAFSADPGAGTIVSLIAYSGAL